MNVAGEIIKAIKDRGLSFRLYEPRELNLHVPAGKREEVTEALKNAIKAFREEIITLENLMPVPKPPTYRQLPPIPQDEEDAMNEEVDAAVKEIEKRIGPHPSATPHMKWPSSK